MDFLLHIVPQRLKGHLCGCVWQFRDGSEGAHGETWGLAWGLKTDVSWEPPKRPQALFMDISDSKVTLWGGWSWLCQDWGGTPSFFSYPPIPLFPLNSFPSSQWLSSLSPNTQPLLTPLLLWLWHLLSIQGSLKWVYRGAADLLPWGWWFRNW